MSSAHTEAAREPFQYHPDKGETAGGDRAGSQEAKENSMGPFRQGHLSLEEVIIGNNGHRHTHPFGTV